MNDDNKIREVIERYMSLLHSIELDFERKRECIPNGDSLAIIALARDSMRKYNEIFPVCCIGSPKLSSLSHAGPHDFANFEFKSIKLTPSGAIGIIDSKPNSLKVNRSYKFTLKKIDDSYKISGLSAMVDNDGEWIKLSI
jgi:hypothetical protein